MRSKWISDTRIDYDGSQLSSLFAFRSFDLQGDSVIAFVGRCAVAQEHMVDLVDVKAGQAIFSEQMLHFIGEFFDRDLDRMILRERLMAATIFEELISRKPGIDMKRDGDDIYLGLKKATVGIATVSPVSTLFHVGINVSSKNTPVDTIGLDDLEIDVGDFALAVLKKYTREIEKSVLARSKVRGVK